MAARGFSQLAEDRAILAQRFMDTEARLARLLDAARAALPLLVRLGDFIGNGEIDTARPGSLGKRCDAIGDLRAAVQAAEGGKP